MSGLQVATDIVAIIFMSVATLAFLGVLVMAVTLKRKFSGLIDSVQEKIDILSGIPFISKRMFRAARKG